MCSECGTSFHGNTRKRNHATRNSNPPTTRLDIGETKMAPAPPLQGRNNAAMNRQNQQNRPPARPPVQQRIIDERFQEDRRAVCYQHGQRVVRKARAVALSYRNHFRNVECARTLMSIRVSSLLI